MKIKKQNKGFSLVELLVVITIIAILSVVAYTAVGGQTAKARDSKRKEDLSAIQSALEIYAIENSNQYPDTATWKTQLSAKHMPKGVPTDPGAAGKDYVYVKSGITYELAATLENDGDPANFETYMIGNANGLITSAAGVGFYNNSGTLTPCNGGITLNNGDTIGSAATGPCVPYNPNN